MTLPDGFVLAGGRSSRMGFDKARAAWGDVPLAVAVATSLERVCGRVAVVRRTDDGLPWRFADGRELEVVMEPADAEPHPLWGVVTAMGAARTDLVVICACDVPGLTAESWSKLVAQAPSVAFDGVHVHPVIAVLPVSWAERARDLALGGGATHVLTSHATRVLVPDHELADHDDPASLGPGPVAALMARATGVLGSDDPEARMRLAEGERQRLLARGIIDVSGR